MRYLLSQKSVGVYIMEVVFRTDANKTIGLGHVMRCLSIADALTTAGCRVEFLIADDGALNLINNRGYRVTILNSDFQKMEEELKVWPSEVPNLLIVDSYYVTAKYLKLLREKIRCIGGKLIYLDDICLFPYPVDIVIDYNAYSTPEFYDELYKESAVEKPQMILGPTYAPLRSMFRNASKKKQNPIVHNILISTGGSDELHLAIAILRAIESSKKNNYVYHFLLGVMNTDKEEICKIASNDNQIIIHENVSDMKSLVESMDLAITAAGSTLYEISACGVPMITYSLADNQRPGAEAFERLGLAVNAGDLRKLDSIKHDSVMSGTLDESTIEKILYLAEDLSSNYKRRVAMGNRMQEMVDGFGADRMVEKILNLYNS